MKIIMKKAQTAKIYKNDKIFYSIAYHA